MFTHKSHKVAAALAASCCLAGGIALTVGGGAAAQADQHGGPTLAPTTVSVQQQADVRADSPDAIAEGEWTEQGEGTASMSSPFIPGVPHVPADVLLLIGPEGEAHYRGPDGSIFNGPADEVDAAVDAWWAEQMASGVTPEQADEKLKHLQK